MNGKTLAKISLVGLSCLAVTASFIALSNHNVIRPVQSAGQTYTLTMKNDNIAFTTCYGTYGKVRSLAFFQMNSPSNYIFLRNSCYYSWTFGGDHLYETNPILEEGKGIGVSVIIGGSTYYYYDEAKTRQISIPKFSSLSKIELTLSPYNEIPLDTSVIASDGITVKKDTKDQNKYNLTSFPSNLDSVRLYDFISASEHLNKRIIIDQIVFTYNCTNV